MTQRGDHATGVSAQISLYPLRQALLDPPIQEALGIFRKHGLAVEPGAMSTEVFGGVSAVFAALREAYEAAAAHGDIVLVATLSNACPVGRAGTARDEPGGEMADPASITSEPIGIVRSSLGTREAASDEQHRREPAVLEIHEPYAAGLDGLEAGDDALVLYWMHRLREDERGVLRVHPRGDVARKERGVFATRSPARPNPIGASRVRVVRSCGSSLVVEGLDALDGSPVLDVKLERKAEEGRPDDEGDDRGAS